MDTPFIKYITGTQHYDDVLARVASVKHTLWIGTADIKDVYVKAGAKAMPLLAVLDLLARRGIAIRILHAKEPGPAFRDDFDKFPALWPALEMTLCPRIHLSLELTEPSLVNAAIGQFDEVWRGDYCAKCGRKQFCKGQIR